jgi:DNA-binding NtrC family response regulator
VSDVNILIVDDDKDITECVDVLLSQKNYRVHCINDPTHVIPYLNSNHCHLMVLDLMMPKIKGLDLLKNIRDLDPDLAVIVFTAYPSVDSAVSSLQFNVDDYIQKPFDFDLFVDTIDRVLRDKGHLKNPEEELHKTIGKNVRIKRKELSLTLKQLSKRTGLSISLISQIERAESSASVSSLYKLSRALICSISTFLEDY